MKEAIISKDFSFENYLTDNRIKLDESLVSLRLMKVIDDYLIEKKLTKREFAREIKCTESYVSQLMSGTKKFNVSFINKFEEKYNMEVCFVLKDKKKSKYDALYNMSNIFHFSYASNSKLEMSSEVIRLVESDGVYSFTNNNKGFIEI